MFFTLSLGFSGVDIQDIIMTVAVRGDRGDRVDHGGGASGAQAPPFPLFFLKKAQKRDEERL